MALLWIELSVRVNHRGRYIVGNHSTYTIYDSPYPVLQTYLNKLKRYVQVYNMIITFTVLYMFVNFLFKRFYFQNYPIGIWNTDLKLFPQLYSKCVNYLYNLLQNINHVSRIFHRITLCQVCVSCYSYCKFGWPVLYL